MLILIIFFLEYSFLPFVSPNLLVGTNLVVAFLLAIYFSRDFWESLGWTILVGLILDHFSVTPWGIYVAATLTLFLLVDLFRRKLLPTKPEGHLIFLAFLLSFFAFRFFLVVLSKLYEFFRLIPVSGLQFELARFLISGLIFAIMGMLFYKLIKKMEKRFGESSGELKVDRVMGQ